MSSKLNGSVYCNARINSAPRYAISRLSNRRPLVLAGPKETQRKIGREKACVVHIRSLPVPSESLSRSIAEDHEEPAPGSAVDEIVARAFTIGRERRGVFA